MQVSVTVKGPPHALAEGLEKGLCAHAFSFMMATTLAVLRRNCAMMGTYPAHEASPAHRSVAC